MSEEPPHAFPHAYQLSNNNNINPNSNMFQNLIEMNQSFLIKAYEQQNKQNYEESVKNLERISKNFHLLGMMADQIPYTPSIIRENREILAQAHIDKLQEKFHLKVSNHYEYEKTGLKSHRKKKQKKTKWTPEEQTLFLEGLELYSTKNLKKVSEHVKTRSLNQVRSHLQKHQLREKKIQDKNKYEINTDNINL